MDFKYDNKGPLIKPRGASRKMDSKLNTFDWLSDIEEAQTDTDFIEVQFKNTRKGYFRNSNGLTLEKGDVVAVESTPGHDIGTVTLTGRLVLLQMKKVNLKTDNPEIKRVYRKARPVDLEKYEESKAKEQETMIKSRKIAEDLNLNMKIGDVEYQGDGNKAIFYYIADDRVDFRQLIRVLADTFKVRIEMKQIGARQEAGRIGGIGPCGRPLCCSSWMTNFVSVSTSAARYQDISLNPQKLAGQCGKLKCCLNHEVDSYVEAQRKLPSKEVPLETKAGTFYHFKTDIFNEKMTYSSEKNVLANLTTIDTKRVFDIIAQNKKGIKPDTLLSEPKSEAPSRDYYDGVGEESLTRFDREKKKKGGGGNNPNQRNRNNPSNNNSQNQNREGRPDRPVLKGDKEAAAGQNQNNKPANVPNNANKQGNASQPSQKGPNPQNNQNKGGQPQKQNRPKQNQPKGQQERRVIPKPILRPPQDSEQNN